MSALDLTAAVGAVSRSEAFEHAWMAEDDVRAIEAAVTAAAPIIEAAVREQIAREVLAARQKRGDTADLGRDYYERGVQFGMSDAARIARASR